MGRGIERAVGHMRRGKANSRREERERGIERTQGHMRREKGDIRREDGERGIERTQGQRSREGKQQREGEMKGEPGLAEVYKRRDEIEGVCYWVFVTGAGRNREPSP